MHHLASPLDQAVPRLRVGCCLPRDRARTGDRSLRRAEIEAVLVVDVTARSLVQDEELLILSFMRHSEPELLC